MKSTILTIAATLLTMGTSRLVAETPTPTACEISADASEDATPKVRAALDRCRKEGIHRLVFTSGRYEFWPARAAEDYLFVSNNDEGFKRIAFPVTDFNGLEIDGRGATFVFHGYLVPFLIRNSRNVSIHNLSFDFARPFHSEGKVLAVTPESADVEFSEEYPYAIRRGVLVFTDGKKPKDGTTVKTGEVVYPTSHLLAFDPARRETAFMATDYFGLDAGIIAEEIGPRQVRLHLPKICATPGNVLFFGGRRDIPGIIVSDSARTALREVTIYHAGGMGVICQRSSDIELLKVKVTPSAGRLISATADATHFVNCTGRIVMRECVFENQVDDATNIHGLYVRIEKLLSPDRLEVKLVHPQQFGVDFIKPGSRLEVVDGVSLNTRGETVVKSVERLNKEFSIVTLGSPLPDSTKIGDAVASLDANTAEVLIEKCLFRGNRARGILLGSRGKISVVGNTFHTPGSAILFEGDARYWFEQAGVRDIVIRDNTFDNCNYGVWGRACIAVGSGIEKSCRNVSRYNRNIVIENNLFRVFSRRSLLSAYSVDGLQFRNNRVERTNEYPSTAAVAAEPCQVLDSDRVVIEPARESGNVAAKP